MSLCVKCIVLNSGRVEEKYLSPGSRGTDLCLKQNTFSFVISVKGDRMNLAGGLGMLEAYKIEKNLEY